MRLIRDESGVAAVEMALISPVLMMGLLLMFDVAIAVKERMVLDNATRAGAQAVMANVNQTSEVKAIIQASVTKLENVTVSVDKNCTCGDAEVACTNWCTATTPPSVFLKISAARIRTGFLLPDHRLRSQTHVQIR